MRTVIAKVIYAPTPDYPYCRSFDLKIDFDLMKKPYNEFLSTVWRFMNHVDNSSIEDQLNSFKCRSMMVGDMVFVNGLLFLCKSFGWDQL